MIEKQYIDLFTQHRNLINSKSASAINKLRDAAFEAFKKIGFPDNKQEDYKYFDVASEFIPDYGLNLNRVPLAGNPYFAFKSETLNQSTYLYYILNDTYNRLYLPEMDYPEGVFVGSLCDFASLYPSVFEKYYGKIANIKDNGVTAFNSMFVQDGFVVYVPKGIVLEKPIQLINILKSEMNTVVNRRVLLIAEDNAQVKLSVCDQTIDNSQFLVTQVNEIFGGENTVIDFYELEENSDKVTRITSTYIYQEASSNVLVNNFTLNCGRTRNNYHVTLDGQQAETNICGMVVADKEQLVDNFVFMDHVKPHCSSNQLFKYIMMERAKGSFCGRIVVEKDAQKTVAYQNNRNLCVSPDARMYSKPQLEIYADDVKCSHGLTTGQLDLEALFYLRSRGIPEVHARLMLMQAFTADVLEHVRIDELKERLQILVEKRFQRESVRCENCSACK